MSFSVPFVRGKQRPRFDTRSMRTYTPNDTKKAEKQIRVAYEGASLREYGRVVKAPKGVPVTLRVDCYKKQPKSMPAYVPKWLRPRIPDTTKPDWDNVGKLSDALNGIAWDDDTQVTDAKVSKHDRNGVTSDHMDITVTFEMEE